jgi:hypothetical protein
MYDLIKLLLIITLFYTVIIHLLECLDKYYMEKDDVYEGLDGEDISDWFGGSMEECSGIFFANNTSEPSCISAFFEYLMRAFSTGVGYIIAIICTILCIGSAYYLIQSGVGGVLAKTATKGVKGVTKGVAKGMGGITDATKGLIGTKLTDKLPSSGTSAAPAKTEATPEPAKTEATPAPAKTEATPAPAKTEAPEPAKTEAIPEPAKPAPEPAKTEPVQEAGGLRGGISNMTKSLLKGGGLSISNKALLSVYDAFFA